MTPYSKDGTTEGSDTSSISTIDVTATESMFTDVDASPVNGEDEDEEFMPAEEDEWRGETAHVGELEVTMSEAPVRLQQSNTAILPTDSREERFMKTLLIGEILEKGRADTAALLEDMLRQEEEGDERKETKNKRKRKHQPPELNEMPDDPDLIVLKLVNLKQPNCMTGGKLMKHQRRAAVWLQGLYIRALGGILADEMGLGKTIQAISLIAWLNDLGTQDMSLIIVPLSTLQNWVNEFEKWCPSIPVHILPGRDPNARKIIIKKLKRIRNSKQPMKGVIITSFSVMLQGEDKGGGEALRGFPLDLMVVDEAHRLKNGESSKLFKNLSSFSSVKMRLLLTGTPISNKLRELWNIIGFVTPSLSPYDIDQHLNLTRDGTLDTNDVLAKERESKMVSSMHRLIEPRLLCRKKKTVFTGKDSLPPITEVNVWAGLSPKQASLSEWAAADPPILRKKLQEKAEGDEEAMRRLRQIKLGSDHQTLRLLAQHPYTVWEDQTGVGAGGITYEGDKDGGEMLLKDSGKLLLLDQMLVRFRSEHRKVLIFSQFKKVLDIIHDHFINRNWPHHRLDGSTASEERQPLIDTFNNATRLEDAFAFLLSTRAGGQGINLHGADTVILYDSDFNPQNDLQAISRSHRLGQKSPVVVYRLLSLCPVEASIMKKQMSKLKIDQLAMGCAALGRVKVGQQDTECDIIRATKDFMSHKSSGEISASISDEELSLIMDRKRLFPGFFNRKQGKKGKENSSISIPLCGEMYEIIIREDFG
eukprot:549607_1